MHTRNADTLLTCMVTMRGFGGSFLVKGSFMCVCLLLQDL